VIGLWKRGLVCTRFAVVVAVINDVHRNTIEGLEYATRRAVRDTFHPTVTTLLSGLDRTAFGSAVKHCILHYEDISRTSLSLRQKETRSTCIAEMSVVRGMTRSGLVNLDVDFNDLVGCVGGG